MKKIYLLFLMILLCSGKIWAQWAFNESFDASTLPLNWTDSVTVGSKLWTRVASGTYPTNPPHTGAGLLQYDSYNASTNSKALMITPPYSLVNRGSNTPTVSFWMYRHLYLGTYAGSTLNVYINTTKSTTGATLLGTLNTKYTVAPTEATTGWYRYSYNIPASYNTATNYIIFESVSDYENNIQLDDIQYIGYPAGAYPPNTFSATPISSSQINLTFTPNASSNNVLILYNTTGTFTTPSGTPPSVGSSFAGGTVLYYGTSSPLSHTGLTPGTAYYYSAWSYDGTNYSFMGLNSNAMTALGTPYAEGFENITAANATPPGWTVTGDYRSYLSAPGGTYNQVPHSGSKFAAFYYNPSGKGYMMTGGIALTGGVTYEFSYWYITDTKSGWNSLQVFYGLNSTFSSMTAVPNSLISNPSNGTYLQSYSTFTPSSSGIYYFAIACDHNTVPYYLSIDDILLQPAPNMSVTQVTSTQNSTPVLPKTKFQQIIGIQVTTVGGNNPIAVKELDFNTTGTSNTNEIKNAKVYYTGGTSTFDTTTLFGSNVAAPGSSFNITGTQTLFYGTNYFWLVFDVAACATVGDNIDASCTLVKYDSVSTVKTSVPSPVSPVGYRQIQTAIQESFTGSSLPAGWSTSVVSGTSSVVFARITTGSYPTNNPYSSPGMVQYNSYSASSGCQAMMVSPSVDLTSKGSATPSVSFWMYRHNAYPTYAGTSLDVYINTSPTYVGGRLLGTLNAKYTAAPVEASIGWYNYNFVIPSTFNGSINYIIFVATSDYYNNIQLDDITISNFPSDPVANFSASDTTCVGTPLMMANASQGANYYSWYYNGQFKTHNTNLTVIPSNLGPDTITLIAESAFCNDTITKKVTIVNPTRLPNSDFIADRNLIEEGETVNFTDLTTFCPSAWEWKIMPDTVNDPVSGRVAAYSYLNGTSKYSQNPSVAFYYGGTYSVTMIASNGIGTGTTQYKQDYIIVKASASLCIGATSSKLAFGNLYDDGGSSMNYTANMRCNYLIDLCASKTTLTFSDFDLLSGDTLRIYDGVNTSGVKMWDVNLYPKGLTGNITNPNFRTNYVSNSGKIFVEFRSDGSNQGRGFKASWSSTTGTFAKPTALFAADDTICANVPYLFINKSTGNDLTYQWDINQDGYAEDNGKDLTLNESTPGVYPITLIVNNCGGYDTFTKSIVVSNPAALPVMRLTADNLKPRRIKDLVSFTDISGNCPLYQTWKFTPNKINFANGTNSHSTVPVVQFLDTGYYTVELIDSNAAGINNIVKTNYIYVLEYCSPTVANKIPDIGISRVVIANVDNSTSCGVNAYSDYTNSVPAIQLQAGATYDITLERITYSNAMSRKVWIDYNSNGNFTDAGELVAIESSANTQRWKGSFKVPAVVPNGFSVMRIGTSYDNLSNTPCGPNMFGEFEDYRVVFSQDFTPPVITLRGKDTVMINQCSGYIDSGAVAIDNVDGNISSKIIVTNNLKVSKAGTYQYKYNVSDMNGNVASEVTRTVIVRQDTVGPLLSLRGKISDTVVVYHSWVDPGYIADSLCTPVDRVDVTGTVDTSKVGSYQVIYKAYDKSGNLSVAYRWVHVIDNIPPVITLNGPSHITLQVYDPYIEAGVNVTDNYYNTFTQAVSGTVNTAEIGSYVLTYTAIDGSGNAASPVTRTIDVVDTLPPIIKSYIALDKDTIYLEVFSKFYLPYMVLTDNYFSTLKSDTSGSYYTNFPDGVAKSTGVYDVIYSVTDGSSNKATITFYIKVIDSQKPHIVLLGNPLETIHRFETITDDSALVIDNYSKNIKLQRGGTYYSDYMKNVVAGNYYITYDAVDDAGNVADQAVRYVFVLESNSSISDNQANNNIRVYPNPASGKFNVKIDLQSESSVTITIVNSLGKVVQTINRQKLLSEVIGINLGEFSDGLYYVKVQTEGNSTVLPVVLRH